MKSELRIGVAGMGAIGQTHVERIAARTHGGRVTAATDLSTEFGESIAKRYGIPFFPSLEKMLGAGNIDALLVTSSDDDHEEMVMAGIAAELMIFCEKPLATSAKACEKILHAEQESGKRTIQVGYMRRYDPGYLQLKELILGGEFGVPLMIHSTHRNNAVGEGHETSRVPHNSFTHDIDILRWLVDDEYASVEVDSFRQTRHTNPKLLDPLTLTLITKSGIRMDVEVFLNCKNGYDIQCEVVCDEGILRLPDPLAIHRLKNARRSTPICNDWSDRFTGTYDIEIQDWITCARQGRVEGPNSWDGYSAALVADASYISLLEKRPVQLAIPERPEFYQ